MRKLPALLSSDQLEAAPSPVGWPVMSADAALKPLGVEQAPDAAVQASALTDRTAVPEGKASALSV